MKAIHRTIVIIVLALASVYMPLRASVLALPGASCDDPIELTQGYEQTIWEASTVWYVANTFDLPMGISFYPASSTTVPLHLTLDFGCTPGFYEDPVLCSLFCKENSGYISMPYKQDVSIETDDQGKPRYHVEFGEFYRDMLLRQGIDYNVPVYICATFPCGGKLTMDPDQFNSCMDNAKFMHLGDTVRVKAEDAQRHVIVPYVQWQYDSIRYVWEGEEECILAVGNNCSFDPANEHDGTIMDRQIVQPGGVVKVSSRLLMDYVNDQVHYPNSGGMYFAKFYSKSAGVMKVEKIPSPSPEGEATLLKYGIRSTVYRDDLTKLYAIPDSWVKTMQFYTPTNRIFKMYVGKTADFEVEDAVATYQFDRTEDGHVLSLFESDLKELWEKKEAGSHYLYIRFECSGTTYVLPSLWTPSDCVDKVRTKRIEADAEFKVGAKSKDIYGLYYADWKDGDMTFTWTSTQAACRVYIADTCEVPNAEEPPVFAYLAVPKGSAGTPGTYTCPKETVESWADYMDPDGYLYVRFYSTAQANMTVSSTAPEEVDPICPTHDSITDIIAWDSCVWRGRVYKETGTYKEDGTLDPETDCLDSTFTLNLKIRTTSYATYEETACDSIIYHNRKYTESGEYKDTIGVTGGNRLITTLTLTIPQSTQSEHTIRQYEPYISDQGVTYSESGDYFDTIPNDADCDSVLIYHITIYNTTYSELTESGCDELVIDEKTYTETGIYLDTIVAESGDREIKTLDLTIGHTTYYEITESACEEYISSEGNTYTESGDYEERTTNLSGCDSIITLHLTIGHTTYGEWTGEACEEYKSPRGIIYTESGDYEEKDVNSEGCDSIITLHLTVIPDCTIYDTVYFCDGQNTEHLERWDYDHATRFIPYIYESPAEWDYMEGVIISQEHDRALVDLARAEQNLYDHYVDSLTSVKSIVWSYRLHGTSAYSIIEVQDEPQWIETGVVALTVRFVCGQMYTTDFATDIESMNDGQVVSEKMLLDGQVVILRNGIKYNLLGTKIE